ncbi:probable low affinity copper uptake protein 2 [Empidonax traillii]|uniref:probable low affinity copper uptake protein 2 n=1 Tax=Empidonax traillii TaxID=164674 RepID=UPI000FFD4A83|nr:probable low affinity copper uptake protein 2 [Empidonax traillii]
MTGIVSASSSFFRNWGKKIAPCGKTPDEHQLSPLGWWVNGSRGVPCAALSVSLFQMTFYFSDTAVLLFDFWNVHSPTGRPWDTHPPILPSIHPSIHPPLWFRYHVGQTLFHVVQVVLGYMVMLAVMSYNAWIFLGAIAGSTLGYFVVYPLLGRG